ncbi:hypothetical protein HOY82DRAFT_626301 [Tuber indicum]|nr:hypothetical protein HOY82DRAFT_626301 [Tuber indicum]
MNPVSQSVPCLPTVFKLGLVTPDTPSFPLRGDREEEAHDSKRLRSSQAQKEGTSHAMDSHIPTPTLTNSPGSPLEMEYSYEEFERYLPLSNFPTPPLSDQYSPELPAGLNFEDVLNPELYGPASYLCSMLPKNASREAPSTHLLQSILQRANVAMEVVGLASCILDCLTGQFVRRWRQEYCAAEGSAERCEVLAVAALCIALKFLEDTSLSSRMWARDICGDRFSPRMLSITERLILGDVGFSIAGICTAELIQYSINEMKRHSKTAPKAKRPSCPTAAESSPSKQFTKTTFPRLSELDSFVSDTLVDLPVSIP